MLKEMFFLGMYSFIACTTFSILFHCPKKELLFCGLCGSVSRMILYLIEIPFNDPVLGTLLAAAGVTVLARFLSYIRRSPSTMYHLAGILPLVPGMYLYNTMWNILTDDLLAATSFGISALKIAGVIGIGSIIVFALPYSAFEFIKIKEKKA